MGSRFYPYVIRLAGESRTKARSKIIKLLLKIITYTFVIKLQNKDSKLDLSCKENLLNMCNFDFYQKYFIPRIDPGTMVEFFRKMRFLYSMNRPGNLKQIFFFLKEN